MNFLLLSLSLFSFVGETGAPRMQLEHSIKFGSGPTEWYQSYSYSGLDNIVVNGDQIKAGIK